MTGYVDSLQAALAGEHAAVWAFPVIAAKVESLRTEALASRALHRLDRERLVAQIVSAGATPVGSEASYTLPFPVTDSASARKLAALIENRLAGLYADVVGQAPEPAGRTTAARSAATAATRAAQWSGTTSAWPGA